ncbi:MAG: DUF4365 domain-containing protein, partial [Pseudomonadota bacterium]
LIFLEEGGELSGQIIFAQVKCIKAKKGKDGNFRIPISKKKLSRNLHAWRKVVGAAIVVLVDPDSLTARWVDIKPSHSSTPGQILVPEWQFFSGSAKQLISALCGTLHQDLQAQKVHTFADDFTHLRSAEHIQPASRKMYISLDRSPIFLGGGEEHVHFDREGWRHITRPARSCLSRYQSFVLLGTVRKIIETCETPLAELPTSFSKTGNCYFFQIDSMVTFPFRQTGLVRLILRKSATDLNGSSKLKFWTIYEPRRKQNGLGVQEPRDTHKPEG